MKLEAFDLSSVITPLADWYRQNRRTLAWREDPTPYHVWISEIMLQQTRVEAVKSYYERFLRELPDVYALADCEEERYLKLWEGLGYYSRVRNLHKAAVQIVREHNGALPQTEKELRKLPGIGSYTCGAILSIAYEKPVPAIDGNVLRILSRLTGDDSDIMLPATKTRAEAVVRAVMEQSTESPRILSQAFMELGALVCVPNGAPHCEACPWNSACIARKDGLTDRLPVKTKAKERRIEQRTVLILLDHKTAALHKRPAKGLLAGLWELPNLIGHMTQEEAVSYVQNMGYSPLHIKALGSAKHIFSHIEWHMIGYLLRIEESAFASDEQLSLREKEELVFADSAEVQERYSIPNAFSAYMQYFKGLSL